MNIAYKLLADINPCIRGLFYLHTYIVSLYCSCDSLSALWDDIYVETYFQIYIINNLSYIEVNNIKQVLQGTNESRRSDSLLFWHERTDILIY